MSERSDVQNPMLKYAQEIGWEHIKQEEALYHREGLEGIYLKKILESQLIKLNSNIVNKEKTSEIIRQLNLLGADIEGNKNALSWMRGEMSIFIPEENRERNIKLIDFENPANNIYQVTDEWVQKNHAFTNRADVVFLINGIPVAIAETKGATKDNAISEGIKQIRRYHTETPEMFIATQVFEVTQLLDFYYGVSWNHNRKNLFNWNDECEGAYEDKIKTFFNHNNFLKLLGDYIIFLTKDDELTKVILRQHQTRAVEKVVERVQESGKKRGLIWHTQGSGKTLTMITIASKLLKRSYVTEKPTVLMIIDRNELEGQLLKNITSYGISNYKLADTKKKLKEILASDYRGLIVSMIHKFDDIPANINTRDNYTVLIDEAHRTTGGDLGNYLMAALPNATFIGFTGTPIDRISKGKGTFKVFGVSDEKGYLDKYSIADSIEDGTTVRLNYSLAPSDLLVNKEILEKEFLNLRAAEGLYDLEELDNILSRATQLKEILKAPDRVDGVAKFVAEHFKENVEPMGFKAFLVGVDREACVLYKKALDKYLPPEYSRVVYSSAHNDSKELKEYKLSEDEEKKIRREFPKKTTLPKILIVTEKLLTGYDAPILYCMYLDKPMRDHVLLQAIARVNRPYEDAEGLIKPFGFVLDFVGIFEKLEKALAFDSDMVCSVIQNIDVLKQLFSAMMEEQSGEYLAFASGWNDKAKEKAIDYFKDKKKREDFFRFYKQIQNLYNIFSPDVFLRPYIDDFKALSELYSLIRLAYQNRIYIDDELTEKTKQLLRNSTIFNNLKLATEVYELGTEELRLIRDSGSSDNTKILNLSKVLSNIVSKEGQSKPYLQSIGERAEQLILNYEEIQDNTAQTLAGFEKLIEEYIKGTEEHKKLGLNENAFALFFTLRQVKKDINPEEAVKIDSLFYEYPDYQWNEHQNRQIRAKLYKELMPILGEAKIIIEVTKRLMRLKRI